MTVNQRQAIKEMKEVIDAVAAALDSGELLINVNSGDVRKSFFMLARIHAAKVRSEIFDLRERAES